LQRTHCGAHGIKTHGQVGPERRQRQQFQRGFGDDTEQSFRADEQPVQVEPGFVFMRAPAELDDVAVGEDNLKVSKDNLELTRQKLEVGVSDNVEVIQAQQAVADAQLDLINSELAHNVAKLSLARAIGDAEERLPKLMNQQ